MSDNVRNQLALLADRTLAGLNDAYDYYLNSKRLWRFAQLEIKKGLKFRIRNRSTGTITNEQEFVQLAQVYVRSELAHHTFHEFVSHFEAFFFDCLRIWLSAYPYSLSKKQIEFATVLAASDKDAVVAAMIDKELNDLKYKRVDHWFHYAEELTGCSVPPTDVEIISEIKASRDIMVHNSGVANETYRAKSGLQARAELGEMLDIPERYHRESWTKLKQVVTEYVEKVVQKTR